MSLEYGYMSKQLSTWFFVNVLGFGVLGILILVLSSVIAISLFMVTPFLIVTTFIITIPISFAQWVALRKILQTSILWIITVPCGVTLAILFLNVIPDGLWQVVDDESTIVLTAGYLIVGCFIGVLQWLLLRQQLARASIWILGSAISVAVSFWFILVTGMVHRSGVISYIAIALIYSIVTGLFLFGLLSYNNRPQIDVENAT